VQNVEKLRIYIYMAAAAAEIFINCLRQRRRRLRTVWLSAAAAAQPLGLHLYFLLNALHFQPTNVVHVMNIACRLSMYLCFLVQYKLQWYLSCFFFKHHLVVFSESHFVLFVER
jgi:hypothetical protein